MVSVADRATMNFLTFIALHFRELQNDVEILDARTGSLFSRESRFRKDRSVIIRISERACFRFVHFRVSLRSFMLGKMSTRLNNFYYVQ